MSLKSVLFIGTFSPPVTGQSAAFELIYDRYQGPKYKVNKWPQNNSFLGKIFAHLKAFTLIVYYLVFKKIDFIYATTFSSLEGSISDFFLLSINKIFRKKVVIHLHGSQFRQVIEGASQPYKGILIQLFQGIDAAIVLSEGMKEHFSWLIPESKIYVVANYYDPILEAMDPSAKKPGEVLRIGYLSNLMYVKGILYLVDAVVDLHEKGHPVSLDIAGKYLDDYRMSGKELQEILERKIEGKPYITLHGALYAGAKMSFFQNIDVFVLPSFYRGEAQPLSIIEAYRSGCAVIACDINYISDLVKKESGFTVKTESAEAISEPILFYLTHPDILQRTKEYNVVLAEEKYYHTRYVKDVLSVFDLLYKPRI